MRTNRKYLNVFSVNIFCLIFGILFLTIGNSIQDKNFFLGTFITEVFILLIPSLIVVNLSGRAKSILNIKKISFTDLFLVILVTILSYPIILLFNGIFLTLISKFVEFNNFSMDLFTKSEIKKYFIFVCFLPSICEEIFFRGAVLSSYDIYGRKFAIFMSSFVFALSHFDIQNFIAPLLLGILFSNMMELTGSIFAPITAHFTNNIIAIIFAKYLNDYFFKFLSATNFSREIGSVEVFTIVVLTFASIISFFAIRYIFKYMNKKRKVSEIGKKYRSLRNIELFSFIPIFAEIILYLVYNFQIFRR